MSAEDAPSDGVDVAMLARMDNRIDQLEATCERQQREIDDLREENQTLKARTDLLDLVENSDEMDGMQRTVALLQHLQKKAEQDGGRGRAESAAVDADRALEVLHYPEVDRTAIYKDFERAQRLVGDGDVCWYDGGQNARLVLNLENGDVPAKFATNGEGSA
jgi:hypothetical protein